MHPDETGPLDEGADDIRALLAWLDHPAPPVFAATIAAQAQAHARGSRRRTALRWAAAVLLTLGAAGAAVAAPGSPVFRWAAALVARMTEGRDRQAPRPGHTAGADRGKSGIAVAPGEAFAVVFTAWPAGGVASVSLGERDQIVVWARPGAARFTTQPDSLLIAAGGTPDTFMIEIPRTARRVELRAGGARLLLAELGRVVPASAPDSLGRYRVPLPPSGGP